MLSMSMLPQMRNYDELENLGLREGEGARGIYIGVR